MVNIWDYKDATRVKVTTVDGEVFTGRIEHLCDAEETYNDPEDSLELGIGKPYGLVFFQSEIAEIEVLD